MPNDLLSAAREQMRGMTEEELAVTARGQLAMSQKDIEKRQLEEWLRLKQAVEGQDE